jgi:hypothetical protein
LPCQLFDPRVFILVYMRFLLVTYTVNGSVSAFVPRSVAHSRKGKRKLLYGKTPNSLKPMDYVQSLTKFKRKLLLTILQLRRLTAKLLNLTLRDVKFYKSYLKTQFLLHRKHTAPPLQGRTSKLYSRKFLLFVLRIFRKHKCTAV